MNVSDVGENVPPKPPSESVTTSEVIVPVGTSSNVAGEPLATLDGPSSE